MITIEDFKKMELVVAKVVEVKDHPKADRLYVLKVDIGSEERQLVAGIRPFYSPQQLVGKHIVVISNLQPATIRGEESKGMLLAVSDEKGISIIGPDRDVAPGSAVQ